MLKAYLLTNPENQKSIVFAKDKNEALNHFSTYGISPLYSTDLWAGIDGDYDEADIKARRLRNFDHMQNCNELDIVIKAIQDLDWTFCEDDLQIDRESLKKYDLEDLRQIFAKSLKDRPKAYQKYFTPIDFTWI